MSGCNANNVAVGKQLGLEMSFVPLLLNDCHSEML